MSVLAPNATFFSEAGQRWQTVPKWADFLMRFGYSWPVSSLGQRRIALISMPCDSAAAGLIALGALIRDLTSPNTNDVDGHYDALLRYAHQYLGSCRGCSLPECNPGIKHCGYLTKATGRLRSTLFPRKLFIISERTDLERRQLVWQHVRGQNRSVVEWGSPQHAVNWYVDGDPPPQVYDGCGGLPLYPYRQILGDVRIIAENLSKTWSGLCLAGRVTGGAATRQSCTLIRFQNGAEEHGLENLLTIHGWSRPDLVSRMAFFNARTERLDRHASTPALVIADGDAAFLKVIGLREFQRSDVMGVIHRTTEREHLEDVGNRIVGLRQWYADDTEIGDRLPSAPPGLNLLILKRVST